MLKWTRTLMIHALKTGQDRIRAFYVLAWLFPLLISPAQAASAGKAPSPKRAESTRQAFDGSWDYYKWRIEQGDDLDELEKLLVRIQTKYANTRVNHEMVRRELAAVRALRTTLRSESLGGE